MKLGIRLHLTESSLSNTISGFESFGVQRRRKAVHDWRQEADLPPVDGKSPDHVAVGETVIQIEGERYWQYAAVDPASDHILHIRPCPGRTTASREMFLRELKQKYDVEDVPCR